MPAIKWLNIYESDFILLSPHVSSKLLNSKNYFYSILANLGVFCLDDSSGVTCHNLWQVMTEKRANKQKKKNISKIKIILQYMTSVPLSVFQYLQNKKKPVTVS